MPAASHKEANASGESEARVRHRQGYGLAKQRCKFFDESACILIGAHARQSDQRLLFQVLAQTGRERIGTIRIVGAVYHHNRAVEKNFKARGHVYGRSPLRNGARRDRQKAQMVEYLAAADRRCKIFDLVMSQKREINS